MGIVELLSGGPTELVYGFFIPFLLVFVILWGVLSAFRMFDKKINIIIALAISILAAESEYFPIFANYVGQLGGFTALIAFAVLFLFGIGMYSYGRGRRLYSEHAPPREKREDRNKELKKLYEDLREARYKEDEELEDELLEQIERLKRRQRYDH